jgi:chromate transporter
MNESVKPTFSEALRFWLKLGFISFGGPAGQIAIMHTEVVNRRRWVDESRFLHALNYCMLLPGPEAQQLATYLGWLMHGVKGGVAAGALFVLPAALLLWGLSWVYMACGEVPWIAAIFQGLQPAVLAIVLAALLRLGSKALKNPIMWSLAVLSFAAFFFLKAPFILVIFVAAVIGWFGSKISPKTFAIASGHGSVAAGELHEPIKVSLWQTARTVLVCLALWLLPVLLIGWQLGWGSVWYQQGLFFSKAALVTFGGAYAVLPYVAQQAVEQYAWLSPPQMMTGLALAETTPGPLIMVLQFVGFAGGWQQPGNFSPLLSATLGAAITTWVTFLPSFLFILAGAPYVERLRHVTALSAALAAITAAVVGVILNLAVWFAWHTVVLPSGVDWVSLVVALLLFYAMQKKGLNVMVVVGLGAVYGLIRGFLF